MHDMKPVGSFPDDDDMWDLCQWSDLFKQFSGRLPSLELREDPISTFLPQHQPLGIKGPASLGGPIKLYHDVVVIPDHAVEPGFFQ